MNNSYKIEHEGLNFITNGKFIIPLDYLFNELTFSHLGMYDVKHSVISNNDTLSLVVDGEELSTGMDTSVFNSINSLDEIKGIDSEQVTLLNNELGIYTTDVEALNYFNISSEDLNARVSKDAKSIETLAVTINPFKEGKVIKDIEGNDLYINSRKELFNYINKEKKRRINNLQALTILPVNVFTNKEVLYSVSELLELPQAEITQLGFNRVLQIENFDTDSLNLAKTNLGLDSSLDLNVNEILRFAYTTYGIPFVKDGYVKNNLRYEATSTATAATADKVDTGESSGYSINERVIIQGEDAYTSSGKISVDDLTSHGYRYSISSEGLEQLKELPSAILPCSMVIPTDISQIVVKDENDVMLKFYFDDYNGLIKSGERVLLKTDYSTRFFRELNVSINRLYIDRLNLNTPLFSRCYNIYKHLLSVREIKTPMTVDMIKKLNNFTHPINNIIDILDLDESTGSNVYHNEGISLYWGDLTTGVNLKASSIDLPTVLRSVPQIEEHTFNNEGELLNIEDLSMLQLEQYILTEQQSGNADRYKTFDPLQESLGGFKNLQGILNCLRVLTSGKDVGYILESADNSVSWLLSTIALYNYSKYSGKVLPIEYDKFEDEVNINLDRLVPIAYSKRLNSLRDLAKVKYNRLTTARKQLTLFCILTAYQEFNKSTFNSRDILYNGLEFNLDSDILKMLIKVVDSKTAIIDKEIKNKVAKKLSKAEEFEALEVLYATKAQLTDMVYSLVWEILYSLRDVRTKKLKRVPEVYTLVSKANDKELKVNFRVALYFRTTGSDRRATVKDINNILRMADEEALQVNTVNVDMLELERERFKKKNEVVEKYFGVKYSVAKAMIPTIELVDLIASKSAGIFEYMRSYTAPEIYSYYNTISPFTPNLQIVNGNIVDGRFVPSNLLPTINKNFTRMPAGNSSSLVRNELNKMLGVELSEVKEGSKLRMPINVKSSLVSLDEYKKSYEVFNKTRASFRNFTREGHNGLYIPKAARAFNYNHKLRTLEDYDEWLSQRGNILDPDQETHRAFLLSLQDDKISRVEGSLDKLRNEWGTYTTSFYSIQDNEKCVNDALVGLDSLIGNHHVSSNCDTRNEYSILSITDTKTVRDLSYSLKNVFELEEFQLDEQILSNVMNNVDSPFMYSSNLNRLFIKDISSDKVFLDYGFDTSSPLIQNIVNDNTISSCVVKQSSTEGYRSYIYPAGENKVVEVKVKED